MTFSAIGGGAAAVGSGILKDSFSSPPNSKRARVETAAKLSLGRTSEEGRVEGSEVAQPKARMTTGKRPRTVRLVIGDDSAARAGAKSVSWGKDSVSSSSSSEAYSASGRPRSAPATIDSDAGPLRLLALEAAKRRPTQVSLKEIDEWIQRGRQ